MLLLHQTPRSVDEYRDVVPLLGRSFRAIAMDTLGFGASARPQQAWTIELFASGVLSLMDALGLERAALVGHHTGGVIAMEVAVAAPERVSALVLSGTPYVDAERRRLVSGSRPPIDQVAPSADGSHLTTLWQRRMGFYPPHSGDLLTRYVADALKVLDRVEEGHRAVLRRSSAKITEAPSARAWLTAHRAADQARALLRFDRRPATCAASCPMTACLPSRGWRSRPAASCS